MSTSLPAVFLSYASQDLESARQIASALRGFGIEVWFDQNELRGGDQWDAKIRGQIKACSLFVPIISRTTQARDEAYFRLEWKLADDRSHLMAPGKAFVVPVVIDDTPEYGATVPESFTKAQWTRLPGGEPTTAFIDQIKRLTSPKVAGASLDDARPPTAAPAPPATAAPAKSGLPPWAYGAGIAMIAGVAVAIWSGLRTIAPAGEPASPPPAAATIATAPAADRLSVAVLPFANMSEDAAASSFFADGVHEDLLTNLAYIPELRVVSRTSVMQYRGTAKSIPQIAGELGVGTLLEGSVRRAGDRVRVTAQLIDAATDEHLWAQTYDRELKDIFAIQAELARAIASALRVALTDQQEESLEKRPTENLAAYELFLRESELDARDGNTEERVRESLGLMQRAVALDPGFALAWANLGVLHAQMHFWYYDRTPERLAQATAAIEKALSLAPGDLDVKTFAGSYHYYGFRDYEEAARYYREVVDVAPNHVDALASLGFIRRREGSWRESIELHERALAIDPRNLSVLNGLFATFMRLRHFDRAAEIQERIVQIHAGDLDQEARWVFMICARDNSLEPLREWVAAHQGAAYDDVVSLWQIKSGLAYGRRDFETIRRLLDHPPFDVPEDDLHLEKALLAHFTGNEAAKRVHLQQAEADARAKLATAREDVPSRVQLFQALLFSGQTDAAREQMELIKSHVSGLNDAVDGERWRDSEMLFHVWNRDAAAAMTTLRTALRVPGGTEQVRLFFGSGLEFSPIWDSPELAALRNDDDAWAPIPVD